MVASPMAGGSGYPVALVLPQERELSRWWGLLFLGMFVRGILAIPHIVILMVLGLVASLVALVVWIPILVNGRVPSLWCSLMTEILHRSVRVSAYVMLFPGGYPAMGFGEPGPVDLSVDAGDRRIGRWWGLPFVGLMARFIVLIPQLIVVQILGVALYVVMLVLWIPILMNGRYPELAMKIAGVYLQYSMRVSAYASFLPVPYPPFDFA